MYNNSIVMLTHAQTSQIIVCKRAIRLWSI